MNNRDIGQEILDGIKEIKQFKQGKIKLKTRSLSQPSPPKVIRQKLRLSQTIEKKSAKKIQIATIREK